MTDETRNKTRILLADDQVMFVDNLKIVLEAKTPDFEIVGIARTGAEAISMACELSPHIVLMDIQMPEVDGVEATRAILTSCPGPHIIMVTKFDDDEYLRGALEYGAAGYILKEAPPAQLIETIRAVRQGSFFFSPGVVAKFLHFLNNPGEPQLSNPFSEEELRSWYRDLGRREKEILDCIAAGQNNKEIAVTLNLAVQTVKNHVSNIYFKLGVHDRVKLIAAHRKALREDD